MSGIIACGCSAESTGMAGRSGRRAGRDRVCLLGHHGQNRAQRPVYKLLGGRCHERLRVYANGWYRGPRRPGSFHDKATEVVARGYTALRFDPFGSSLAPWSIGPTSRWRSPRLFCLVRDAVGPHVDIILIEGHNRFSVHTALQFAEAMAPYAPTWFRRRCTPPQRISSMVEVARRSPVPIACGEKLLLHPAVQRAAG